jgi:hypothetical protein
MTKRQYTACGIVSLVIGILGGIAGTAFSMGADKQRIKDTLTTHAVKMLDMKVDDKLHEEATQRELDRFSKIIAAQITQLQGSITNLTDTVGELRTDVHVLKALMERMDKDFQKK